MPFVEVNGGPFTNGVEFMATKMAYHSWYTIDVPFLESIIGLEIKQLYDTAIDAVSMCYEPKASSVDAEIVRH